MKQALLVVLTLLGCVLPLAARSEPVLQVVPACGGNGLSGWTTDGLQTVHFESCGTIAGGVARIRTPEGAPLSELRLEGSNLSVLVGGVAIGGALTPPQEQRVLEAILSPAGALASGLPAALIARGHPRESAAMRLLSAALIVFEGGPASGGPRTQDERSDCWDEGSDCLGCCGYGCAGCLDVCTRSCRVHDLCVRERKATECLLRLLAAMESYLQCRSGCTGFDCIECR